MKKYVCEPCGYEYDPAVGDPDNGIARIRKRSICCRRLITLPTAVFHNP